MSLLDGMQKFPCFIFYIKPDVRIKNVELSHDDEFLRETFKNTVKADEYTKKMFNIYDAVMKNGGPAQVIFGKKLLIIFINNYRYQSF
jgi:hypothetical protein